MDVWYRGPNRGVTVRKSRYEQRDRPLWRRCPYRIGGRPCHASLTSLQHSKSPGSKSVHMGWKNTSNRRGERQNLYFIGSRLFELPELKLLVDAVESSHFITRKEESPWVIPHLYKQSTVAVGTVLCYNYLLSFSMRLTNSLGRKSKAKAIFQIVSKFGWNHWNYYAMH